MEEQISMFMTNEEKVKKMEELINTLNEASRAYYQEAKEIMPNFEYDRTYDMLVDLEKETGIILSNSPTQHVGYQVISELPKEAHPSKMLSLDKTKDVNFLCSFIGDKEGVMSWKLDGLTIVLTYKEGKLFKAVTRGNGEVGEVITQNALNFDNVPVGIPFKGDLVLRGEAVIRYDDFDKINDEITDESSKYKNPRNLCSGSVRQLDPMVTKSRHVNFYAFTLVSVAGKDSPKFKLRSEQFEWLDKQGFDVVYYKKVTSATIPDTVKWYSKEIYSNPIPSDGLVLTINDIEYGKSLGVTAKYPKDSIAFKWQDEVQETTLNEIEWSASRTGLINPVAVFDPVELEGTTVKRASVHNISVMKELKLGIGDKITVYKANMIIPQIADNLTMSNKIDIPKICPACHGDTFINCENNVETLMCLNPKCPAKEIKGFTHFASRDAMNIDGMSEMTIEKLVDLGCISEYSDFFHIDKFKDEIIDMDGFGEKSYKNMYDAIEASRKQSPERLLYALGIPNFGRANAKIVANYAKNKWEKIEKLSYDELITIDQIGDVMARAYVDFFNDENNKEIIKNLLKEVTLDETYIESGNKLEGLTFVITGSLNTFKNRDELKEKIELEGGHVAGSVSKNTSFLINNDLLSQSGKNKEAQKLGIKIIDEETIIRFLVEGIK